MKINYVENFNCAIIYNFSIAFLENNQFNEKF